MASAQSIQVSESARQQLVETESIEGPVKRFRQIRDKMLNECWSKTFWRTKEMLKSCWMKV